MATTEDNDAARVTLREVTKETVRAICRLKVREGQEHLVASNAVSIAEAHFEPRAWFRAVYAGEDPVGFVMVYEDPEGTGNFPADYAPPLFYLWRFMIDGEHQGKGYGGRALELVIDHVRERPGAKELFLSVVPGEGSAEELYRRFGFERTGRFDEGEAELRLALGPQSRPFVTG
jgi:diamine N-acetyltransferase